MHSERQYSLADRLIGNLDRAVSTVFGNRTAAARPNPAGRADDAALSQSERDQALRLMRVNHAGEVAAQALYHGQASTAKLPAVREKMEQAAAEETDHLAWCAERIHELGGRPSLLGPFWYAGSFAIGAGAGLISDRASLGFVAETERQVVRHLESHEQLLPSADTRSRAIVAQMKQDEAEHGAQASAAGGMPLPGPVKGAMGAMSKVMTTAAWWL